MGNLRLFLPMSIGENNEILLKLIKKVGAFKVRGLSDFKLTGENGGIKAPFWGKGECGFFSIELTDEDRDATSGPCRIVAKGIVHNGIALADVDLIAFYRIERNRLRISFEGRRSGASAAMWKVGGGKSRVKIDYRKAGAKASRWEKLLVTLKPRR